MRKYLADRKGAVRIAKPGHDSVAQPKIKLEVAWRSMRRMVAAVQAPQTARSGRRCRRGVCVLRQARLAVPSSASHNKSITLLHLRRFGRFACRLAFARRGYARGALLSGPGPPSGEGAGW